MNESELKKSIVETASGMSMMSAMRLNRHERCAMAKVNGVKKIIGSTKPIVNKKKV